MTDTDIDIAVAHDNFWIRGGGERVAENIAQTFDCPLYYGFGDRDYMNQGDIDYRSFVDSDISQRLARKSLLFRDLYQIFKYQRIQDLQSYDVIVQTINNVGWMVPREDQTIIKYVHSTPRLAYDRFPDLNPSLIRDLYTFCNRVIYHHTTRYPDLFIANSEIVRHRLNKYWDIPDKKIETIYPPVDTKKFLYRDSEDYYFIVSRLVDHKNIGQIIEAFNDLGHKLKVAGRGPQRQNLEQKANNNIEFLGYISEQQKRELYSRSKAVVFSAEKEDFGIVPIEGFASGKPCIGVRDGYTQHQIVDGFNGYLYNKNSIGDLKEKIELFEGEGVYSSPGEIEGFSEKFSLERFQEEIRDAVELAQKKSGVDVDHRETFEKTTEKEKDTRGIEQ